MSFFGKIKSAMMGNPVTREYEIGKQVASAGPGLMWKVHQATKKSTRQVGVSWNTDTLLIAFAASLIRAGASRKRKLKNIPKERNNKLPCLCFFHNIYFCSL